MRRRGVVFDIGGVLEINPPGRFEHGWAVRLGLPVAELDARLAPIWRDGALGRDTYEGVRARVATALALDADQSDGFWEDAWASYLGERNERMLGAMQDCYGFAKLGLLSNSFVGARDREEPHLGVFALCDAVVYSHEVGLEKPDPAIYALTAERMRLPPSDLLLVDDLQANVEGARAAGWEAVRHLDDDATLAIVLRFLHDR